MPGPGLLEDLQEIHRLRASMAEEGRMLADNLATLRLQRNKLKTLCEDAHAGFPPLSLLLDNVHHLVLRPAWREGARQLLVVLFYGADAGAPVLLTGSRADDQPLVPALAQKRRAVRL